MRNDLESSACLHAIYNVFVATFAILSFDWAQAQTLVIILVHAAVAFAIVWIGENRRFDRPGEEIFLINFHFVPILAYFFEFSLLISPHLGTPFDPVLAKVDSHSLASLQRISLANWITELLQICYVCFYFLPLALVVALLKSRQDVIKIGQPIVAAFLITYVGYLIVPAYGPRNYFADSYSYPLVGTFSYDWIQLFLQAVEGNTPDAFPSGHTAVTLTVLHLAFVYVRRAARARDWYHYCERPATVSLRR